MQKNLLPILLLLGSAMALKNSRGNRMQKFKSQMLAEANAESEQTAAHTCSTSIERIKSQATFDYNSVITAGALWTDPKFPTAEALGWTEAGYTYN